MYFKEIIVMPKKERLAPNKIPFFIFWIDTFLNEEAGMK